MCDTCATVVISIECNVFDLFFFSQSRSCLVNNHSPTKVEPVRHLFPISEDRLKDEGTSHWKLYAQFYFKFIQPYFLQYE